MEVQRVRRPEGPQDWATQRAVITDLYIAKGLELEDVMKTMEGEHFFKATKKQYKSHFTEWDLKKNVRPSEYNAIIKKKRKREEDGKDSAFRLRGAPVDDSKIVRYEKRMKTGDEHEIAEAGTPENLSCFTPSPVASSPNAPSPYLPHFQTPNRHEVNLKHSKFVTAMLSQVVLKVCDWAKLLFHSKDPETVDAFQDAFCLLTQRFAIYWSIFASEFNELESSLSRLVSCFQKDADRRGMFSKIYRLAIISVSHLDVFDSSNEPSFSVELKPTNVDLMIDILRSIESIPDIHVCAGVYDLCLEYLCLTINEFSYSNVLYLEQKLFLYMERKYSPRRRRSESCESIRSMVSFRSDPVVNWEELLYGHNREAATQSSAEARSADFELLEQDGGSASISL